MALVPAAADPIVIGVDVGGTKVAAAQVVGRDEHHGVSRPTSVTSGEAVIDDITIVIEEVAARAGRPVAVGVGVPSQIEFATGTVLASVNIPLAGVSLAKELRDRIGAPVFVDNDANCAALGEAEFMEEGRARHLVMYTLGTGVGGGVVIDGRIFRGAKGLGAELGHVVVEAEGPPCPGNCPNRGCLEALCSGTALERDANTIARDRPESVFGQIAAKRGKVSGPDVVRAAEDGDPYARDLFERLGRAFGVGLSGAMNTFEPETIVVGGGLSSASHLFLEHAIQEARMRALPEIASRVEISLARAGPRAGVLGAGLLALHELRAGKGDTAGRHQREGVR
jgi:glucokinase